MNINDYIVKDSSIYQDSDSFSLENRQDCSLKVGMVRDIVELNKGLDIGYIVETWIGGKYAAIHCTRATRFGGRYNYEEVTYRGFEPNDDNSSDGMFDFKPGDMVLVAYLMGDSRDGIIVSGINHPGRKRLFKPTDGVVFQSEFNGVNKSINIDGEYTVTFKGQPTNLAKLDEPAQGKEIPDAQYDTEVGSSYYKFDKTGSFTISDNATSDPQSIFIDKPNGKIIITSGKTTMTIDKGQESYTIVNKSTTFNSSSDWNLNTKTTKIDSTSLIDAKAAKIKTKGQWEQTGNIKITGNTTQTGNVDISGNLSTTGITSLAGGANPLIYDIALTIGTGNLGAPVVSNHVFLKTVQTKAT